MKERDKEESNEELKNIWPSKGKDKVCEKRRQKKNGNQTQRDHLLGNIKIKNGIMIERMWISSENKIKCRREKKKK